MWFSFNLSCLGLAKLLEFVNLHLSPNLGYRGPLFPQMFFTVLTFFSSPFGTPVTRILLDLLIFFFFFLAGAYLGPETGAAWRTGLRGYPGRSGEICHLLIFFHRFPEALFIFFSLCPKNNLCSDGIISIDLALISLSFPLSSLFCY